MVEQGPEGESEIARLALFHYVLAGVTALLACIPVIHVLAGLAMLRGEMELPVRGLDLPPEEIGKLFVVLGIGVILLGWLHAVVILMMGRWVARRKHHVLLMVASGMNCVYFPFGTAVSIYALIVLSRPDVAREFGRN